MCAYYVRTHTCALLRGGVRCSLVRLTQSEYEAYLARTTRQRPCTSLSGGGCKDEAELHSQILAHCRSQGWIALHGSMAHATNRTVGEPDFTILADNGRVFWIECKSKTGKVKPEQLALHTWMSRLGHTCHVIRSLEDFSEVVKGMAQPMDHQNRS